MNEDQILAMVVLVLRQQTYSLKTPCNVFVLVLPIEHPAYEDFHHKSQSDSPDSSSKSARYP